jgi:hypothetical protein
MTRTKFVFSYTETRDFEETVEVIMEVPERSIDQMCEFFQRFLTATGYIFENDERIEAVHKAQYPAAGGDVLTFNDDGSPYCYDFGDDFNFAAGPVHLYGAAGNDTIYFGGAKSVTSF